MRAGQGVRVFRWDGAPDELKRAAVEGTRKREPGNLIVWIPAHRRDEDPGISMWVPDAERFVVDLENGDRLHVGTVRTR